MSAVPTITKAPTRSARPRARRASPGRVAKLDGRTKAARVLKDTRARLIAHIGGRPDVLQSLLIDAVAYKAARLWLLSNRLLAGDEPAESFDQTTLSMFNSMRADLVSLGIEKKRHNPRVPNDVVPDDPEAELAAYLAGREAPRG